MRVKNSTNKIDIFNFILFFRISTGVQLKKYSGVLKMLTGVLKTFFIKLILLIESNKKYKTLANVLARPVFISITKI